MPTRAQLHRQRSLLARAWDQHIPAICDKRPVNAERMGVRTEIMASWERSAAHMTLTCSAAPAAADLPLTNLVRLTISPTLPAIYPSTRRGRH